MSRPPFLPDIPLGNIVWGLELPLAALNGWALTVLAVAWSHGPRPLVVVMAAVACAGAGALGARRARTERAPLVGNYVLSRLAALCAVFSLSLPAAAWNRVAAVAAAAGCLMAEPIARAFTAQAFPYAAAFPGVKIRTVHAPTAIIFWANLAAVFLLVVAGDLWPTAGLVVAVAVALTNTVVMADVARFAIGRLRFNSRLPLLWEAMQPTFAVHWQATRGSIHQLTMWMDYLKQLGRPFFVITRTRENFIEVTETFDVPVLHRVGLDAVEEALSPSLKTVFYVNTAILNDHMLRYPHLNHIQLNHGDSDKIASYSPVFRAYDKDFVAGQAAIDRFAAAGLATASDFFVIVGRPQVAGVAPSSGPVRDLASPVALYAPTWTGNTKDSDYTSLRRGPEIVQALLDRGCTVIFRPHPYWAKNYATQAGRAAVVALLNRDAAVSDRRHVFGPAAETDWSIIDCFNHSDLMISDVSSVVNDYLYSEKPFIMMAVTAEPDDFATEFPVARGAYVVDYATLSHSPTTAGDVQVRELQHRRDADFPTTAGDVAAVGNPGQALVARGGAGPNRVAVPTAMPVASAGVPTAVPGAASAGAPATAPAAASDGARAGVPAAAPTAAIRSAPRLDAGADDLGGATGASPRTQTLAAALEAIWGDDPLAPVRRELKTYCLGDIPRAEYAGRFVEEAAKYV
ncbi:MAG: CDP-glycerol glycerophosphotransferase family protein [Bifidobacteriaceae bacterium]|jgi:hypothetical protein|nr:CDP-glycerol glycerophosphotransferase family protein [Bifidobacteriaceae bacterium]